MAKHNQEKPSPTLADARVALTKSLDLYPHISSDGEALLFFEKTEHGAVFTQLTVDEYESGSLMVVRTALSLPKRQARSVIESIVKAENLANDLGYWEFDNNGDLRFTFRTLLVSEHLESQLKFALAASAFSLDKMSKELSKLISIQLHESVVTLN